jgi:nucleoside-diphosphate-sugar epimerase
MRIIILGYTGLIGNSIFKNLVKNTSSNLVCVGRNIKDKPYLNRRIKYLKWNFNSFKKHNLYFLKKADIIINCVGKSEKDKNDLENINSNFVKKLLKYIYLNKYKVRFIHLSSVVVYGSGESHFNQFKLISEKSVTKINNLYSKSKLEADLSIQNIMKKNLNKNFSYTILRISNVFGGQNKSNLLKYVLFSLKFGFWIKCYDDISFNFINVKDVVQSVILIINKLKVSKNKTYIVSDDCKQYQVYSSYQKFYKKKILEIQFPKLLIKFLFYFLPLPKKIVNFMLLISTRTFYSNKKIKNELNFKPKFSLIKQIKYLNEKKI